MKSVKGKIHVFGSSLLLVVVLLAMGWAWTPVAQGRSLYAIGSITSWTEWLPVLVYDIGPDGTLTFQTQQRIPYRDSGAVGIAIDWQSGHLFVTYELSGFLEILDARTMASIGEVSAPGAENLAGIAFDESKGLLYCLDMGSDKLHSYRWYPNIGRLIRQTGSPATLVGSTAYGIALDEERQRLYTANASKKIHVYSTVDWSLIETLTLERSAISVAVDAANNLLYTGAAFISDFTLNQYNLSTGEIRSIEVDPEAGVMGLTVDPATGFVYITTGRNNRPGGDDLLVYDTSLTQIDAILDIGNPTGIVIPAREIGYNPLQLTKTIVTDEEIESGQPVYVSVNEIVTYRICFENAVTISDVSVVDTLPADVTFISADSDIGTGQYDADAHTYSWSLPLISAGSQTCLELQVQVNAQVPIGTVLRNYATIQTRTITPSTVSADAVVEGGPLKPLTLSKQIIGGVEREDGLAYANAGDVVSYTIHYANQENIYPVTQVSVVDALPKMMTFVEADTDGGAYDPVEHTYTYAFSSLQPDASGDITIRGQIDEDTPADTVLTNVAIIDCNETDATTATADVVVRQTELQPLNLAKEVTEGATTPDSNGVQHVNPGDEITYLLCFDNNDNERVVEAISVVDFLPSQLTFVSAAGNGETDGYDPNSHTYVWSVASLAAGQGSCVEIVAQVKEDTPAGTIILNRASIDSDQTEATTIDHHLIVDAIDYQPLGLAKTIADGAISNEEEKTPYIGIGDEVTYRICFDNNDNDYRVYGLSLTDTLPSEVAFVSAQGDGIFGSYDEAKHAYTWSYPSLMPRAGTSFDLVVQVKEDTTPGAVVTNHVTIDSDNTEPQTASVSAIAQEKQLKPPTLTKTVTAGITGQDETGTWYVGLGEELTYTICMTNSNSEALEGVAIIDTLPAEVSFVAADGDGDFGRYDAETHTYTWSYATLEANAQVCLDLTVRVREDARHGVTITNQARVETNDTPTAETNIKVITELEPPLVRKTILAAESEGVQDGEFWVASPGYELTYEICIENNQDTALEDIVAVDTLPAGVTFLSTDNESGYYDSESHTFVWTYHTLEPGTVVCLKLAVRLGYDLQPDTVLRNVVTLDSSQTPPTETDVDVIIESVPLSVPMTLSPLILGRKGYNRSDQITAVLEFPKEILAEDIVSDSLYLDPGSIAPKTQDISNEHGLVKIQASFDLVEVLEAVPTDGITTLYVGGRLTSGRTFVGEATVLVVAERPF